MGKDINLNKKQFEMTCITGCFLSQIFCVEETVLDDDDRVRRVCGQLVLVALLF